MITKASMCRCDRWRCLGRGGGGGRSVDHCLHFEAAPELLLQRECEPPQFLQEKQVRTVSAGALGCTQAETSCEHTWRDPPEEHALVHSDCFCSSSPDIKVIRILG
jgi:hypothetical protein